MTCLHPNIEGWAARFWADLGDVAAPRMMPLLIAGEASLPRRGPALIVPWWVPRPANSLLTAGVRGLLALPWGKKALVVRRPSGPRTAHLRIKSPRG